MKNHFARPMVLEKGGVVFKSTLQGEHVSWEVEEKEE